MEGSGDSNSTGLSHMGASMKPHSKLHFVGGSLGGLGAALALRDLGHDTTILERNPSKLLHNQGAGIVAGGDTLEFLKRYNRCKRSVSVASQKRQYYNRDGQIVHERVMTQNMTSWDLMYYILRANYDGVESDYCDTPKPMPHFGKVLHLHGCRVTRFEPIFTGGVKVFHADSRPESQAADQEASIECDILIAADGPSSTIRRHLFPQVERTYAGYCALRGTVPESSASPSALDAFRERFAFYHAPGIQILAYLIPGSNGTTDPGERLINFVYYTNFDEKGSEIDEIMTDRDGKRHRITMPPGMISPEAWERQKHIAKERLPPQFAEIVCATKHPFVQAITDVISPTNSWGPNGNAEGGVNRDCVVLIGDALAGFRPHTVASTSQACFDSMRYADFIGGKISREEWKRETMGYARFVQRRGVQMGMRSQFGENDGNGGRKELPLEDLIQDRDEMSKPLQDVVWPDWAVAMEA